MRAIVIGLIIFLASCTLNRADYTQNQTSFRGATANFLIQQKGTPDEIIRQRDGTQVYIYKTGAYRQKNPPQIGMHVTPEGKPILLTPNNIQAMPPPDISCVTTYTINRQGFIIGIDRNGSC